MNFILLLLLTSSGIEHKRHEVWSKGKINFVLDYSRFYRSDSLSEVEFYLLIDTKTLPLGVGQYETEVTLTNTKGQVNTSQWSSSLSKRRVGTIVDIFRTFVKPDTYRIAVIVKAGNTSGSVKTNFVIKPMPSDLSISDLELVLKFFDDSTSKFYKHGVAVLPNPSHTYQSPTDTLRFYYEVYGMEPDTGYIVLNHLVEDTEGNPVLVLPPRTVPKNGRESLPWADEIPIASLPSGPYFLRIQIVDLSSGRRVLGRTNFFYTKPEARQVTFPDSLIQYLEFINYFASEQEQNELSNLTGDAKKAFLIRFWKRYDPDPLTLTNEFLRTFIERVRYADNNFGFMNRKGRYSDRGRIYIRYGPPDQIERKAQSWASKDVIKWIYYRRGEMEFIFVDLKQNGDYELVYSSIPEEPSRQDWRELVKEDVLDW